MTVVPFLDVDGLKEVNDEQGHDAGDQLLVNAADLLRDTFRDSDVIARLGGDEFCVVGAAPSSTGDRQALMSRFQDNLARHNATRDESSELSVSLGVSWSDPRRPRRSTNSCAQRTSGCSRRNAADVRRRSPSSDLWRKAANHPPNSPKERDAEALTR
jgi:diguanylate cyclase (GGDEF)-like protein